MIVEQDLYINKQSSDILSILFEKKKYTEKDEGIEIIFLGEKDEKFQKEILEKIKSDNTENYLNDFSDPKNNLLYIKYKNIYIGGISIYNFNIRDGFGLNKYEKNNAFYLGQWKNNMKEGIGYLKINDSQMYIGSFHENQIEGFGMLYYKNINLFFFGDFKSGSFNNGIYLNYDKGLFYRGKFKNNKKSDSFCSFLEMKNKHLFLGEVDDDIFTKGYLGICHIEIETHKDEESQEENNVTSFGIEKIFYFDKTNSKNIKFIHSQTLDDKFYGKVNEIMNEIFMSNIEIKKRTKIIFDYFNYLESLKDDEDFNNDLERYNGFDNEQSLEKFFLSNYNFYHSQCKEAQENIDLNEFKKEIEKPEINKDLDV